MLYPLSFGSKYNRVDLLHEFGKVRLSTELHGTDELGEISSLDITLDERNTAIAPQCSHDQGTVLVEGEVAREVTTCGENLLKLEGAVRLDCVVNDRVRLDLSLRIVLRVVDGDRTLVA